MEQHLLVAVDRLQGQLAHGGLDTPHAGGNGGLALDTEGTGLGGVVQVCTAAELHGEVAHLHHADHIAILLAEHGHSTLLLGLLDGQDLRDHGIAFQNGVVYQTVDLAELLRGNGLEMRKVEAQAVGLHQRAGLVDMVAQDLLQCGIQQMGSAVGTHNSLPAVHIDGSGNGVAHPELTGEHLAVVHELTALVLQDVGHFKLSVAGGDDAVVGHLAAHLGIEGSLVQNNDGLHAGHDSLRQLVFHHQSQHLGISDGGMVVTHELSSRHVTAELDTGPA